MTRKPFTNSHTVALAIVALGVVVTGLVVGRSFLIPLVVAIILANLIEAMIERLERFAVPTVIAYAVSITVVGAALIGIGWIAADQAGALSRAWPAYVNRFDELTTQLFDQLGKEVSDRLSQRLDEIQLADRIPGLIGSLGGVMLSGGLVMLYVGFLLAERGHFSAKLASLVQRPDEAGEMQHILTSVSSGVRRYIWIKTLMSVLTAGVSYATFVWIDLDFAETWALLIFLLNYIPSIGSVLGVVFPSILALIQFETLYPFLLIAVVLSAAQFSIGNILEPIFMGRILNLSPFVIIVSLTFWSTIWGVVGAFLSVPITVMVLIWCANLKSLRWVAVLLSRDGRIDSIDPNDNASSSSSN